MTATARFRAAAASGPAAAVAAGCCLAAGAVYVALDDPSDGSLVPPCPFRTVTGWWCPGCGLTRATHHLLRGDVVQALRYHAFVIVVLGAVVGAWLVWVLRATGRLSRPVRVPPWLTAVAIATLVTFAVVRNLPAIPHLRG